MNTHPTPDALLASYRQSLAQRIQRLARPGEPLVPQGLPDTLLLQVTQPAASTCSVYKPCLALIMQGSKRVMVGDDTLTYGPGRYLIASMNLPVQSAILEATPEQPYLALVIHIDWRMMADLMLDIPQTASPPAPSVNRAVTTGAESPELLAACDRLIALLDDPTHLPALAPLLLREIHYWLLIGEAGPRLRQMAAEDGQSHQIARAIACLNARFAEPLPVDTLARVANMSPSTFHHHFKAITAMSPLQYQKQLRLAEARRLMLTERIDAASAAYRVGYESPSQFSREYSRQFGQPPSRDLAALKAFTEATAST